MHSKFLYKTAFIVLFATPFKDRARALNGLIVGRLTVLLKRRERELTHPDAGTAALFTIALIAGLTRDALLVGYRVSEQSMDLEAFKGELRRAVFGYLGVSAE